jgi:hypothetical protein
MTSRFSIAACGALLAIAAAAAAADKPKTLAAASPGLWELTGVQGSKTAVRECLTNLATLGQFEHRARTCKATTLSDTGKVTVINYSCGAGDFGRTSIKFVTPRNLKVETQGISDGLPFGYTMEARRVGECKPAAAEANATERGN